MSAAQPEFDPVFSYLRPFFKKQEAPLSTWLEITPNGLYFQADTRDIFENCNTSAYYPLYLSQEELAHAVSLLKKANPSMNFSQKIIKQLLYVVFTKLIRYDLGLPLESPSESNSKSTSKFKQEIPVILFIILLFILRLIFQSLF